MKYRACLNCKKQKTSLKKASKKRVGMTLSECMLYANSVGKVLEFTRTSWASSRIKVGSLGGIILEGSTGTIFQEDLDAKDWREI